MLRATTCKSAESSKKVGDGKLVFDLNLTSADYDAIELGSSVKYDLLSAESISNFGESLNDDFEILGMDYSQFAADFFLRRNFQYLYRQS